MSLKRALWSFFVLVIIGGGALFCFPQRTTADSVIAATILNTADKDQFDWVSNGQNWFSADKPIVPTRVVIQRLGVDIKLQRGGWNGKDWKITNDSAFFSPQLQQKNIKSNSIFIYGHNTEKIFKATNSLVEGDELMIKLDSGPWVKYIYKSSTIVNPTDVVALARKKSDLILLACHGSNSETRRIMYFSLEK